MPHKYTASYIADSLSLFRYYKALGEGAIRQVSDDQLVAVLDSEMNSIALTIKHMAGNMRSRWTDFLTTDGEKPDRNRDTEFIDPPSNREALLETWERGWRQLFAAIESLSDDDLARTVEIRGEPHSVMQAVNRQIAHYSYHVGQIVFLAKHLRHTDWQALSVPRGQSADFNRRVKAGKASQR
jgi:uncharacterized damage-inducible protein DinB